MLKPPPPTIALLCARTHQQKRMHARATATAGSSVTNQRWHTTQSNKQIHLKMHTPLSHAGRAKHMQPRRATLTSRWQCWSSRRPPSPHYARARAKRNERTLAPQPEAANQRRRTAQSNKQIHRTMHTPLSHTNHTLPRHETLTRRWLCWRRRLRSSKNYARARTNGDARTHARAAAGGSVTNKRRRTTVKHTNPLKDALRPRPRRPRKQHATKTRNTDLPLALLETPPPTVE